MARFGALIVSPDPKLRVQLLSLLSEQVVCDTAIGLGDAIEIVQARKDLGDVLRLVLVDIDLPEFQGNEVLTGLRKWEESNLLEGSQTVQIIALGRSEKKILKAFFHGADSGHLLPLDNEKLLKQIEILEALS